MPSASDQKDILRQSALLARTRVSPAVRAQFARNLPHIHQTLTCVLKAFYERHTPDRILAGYWPMSSELDVRPLLHLLHADGWHMALPVVEHRKTPLLFRKWTPEISLHPSPSQLPFLEPPPTSPLLSPQLFLVPCAGFDRKGGRLGFGGGYYDRTLALLGQTSPILTIGVAFLAQELAQIPQEPHDMPLDYIITEEGLLEIGSRI